MSDDEVRSAAENILYTHHECAWCPDGNGACAVVTVARAALARPTTDEVRAAAERLLDAAGRSVTDGRQVAADVQIVARAILRQQ